MTDHTESRDALLQRLREAVFTQSQHERQHPDGRAGLYYPSIEAAETILAAVSDAWRNRQAETPWEYAGIPFDEAGREWKERDVIECEALVREHADPAHWINGETAEDIPRVTGYRTVRRRKAGQWEHAEEAS